MRVCYGWIPIERKCIALVRNIDSFYSYHREYFFYPEQKITLLATRARLIKINLYSHFPLFVLRMLTDT